MESDPVRHQAVMISVIFQIIILNILYRTAEIIDIPAEDHTEAGLF